LYAIAALEAGHSYINFTPSLGPALPAIDELAQLRHACYYGCDSLMAAASVLDLVRFTELAWRRGHIGQMSFLAGFFRRPYGASEQQFDRPFQALEDWAREMTELETSPSHSLLTTND
jgi:myo-inositol-1-phosphate synthase